MSFIRCTWQYQRWTICFPENQYTNPPCWGPRVFDLAAILASNLACSRYCAFKAVELPHFFSS